MQFDIFVFKIIWDFVVIAGGDGYSMQQTIWNYDVILKCYKGFVCMQGILSSWYK